MQYLYFIEEQDGPIKIGLADDPEFRLRILQVGNPRRLFLSAAIPGDLTLERELHERFAEGRVRGEWFDASTPGLREAIYEATEKQTVLLIHGGVVCPQCREPVIPPRLKFCSSDCAAIHARRRSRDWKRARKMV